MSVAGFGLEPGTRIHFVGVGGSGMRGLAEWALLEGLVVTGSDRSSSEATRRLEALGARLRYAHDGQAVLTADLVVHSTAVRQDNPELCMARSAQRPIFSRGQLLGELSRHRQTIAICGSHGKTTTTALMGHCLRDLWPAHVYAGARVSNFGSSFHFGDSRRLIAEVDESDGTFLEVHNDLSVLTGLSNDHEGHYGSRESLYEAFATFLRRSSLLTKPIVCSSDPEVRDFVKSRKIDVLSYGFDDNADIVASQVRFDGHISEFQVQVNPRRSDKVTVFSGQSFRPLAVTLPMLGSHNVLNALAVFAAGCQLGVSWEALAQAMKSFSGVEQRLERLCSLSGIDVFSDYAHNPQKIAALIETLNGAYGHDRVTFIFEPHRYSRLQSMWQDFVNALKRASRLWILPLYDAGEHPIAGIGRDELLVALKESGQTSGSLVDARSVAQALEPTSGDFSGILEKVTKAKPLHESQAVVFLGAGKSHQFAQYFAALLRKIHDEQKPSSHLRQEPGQTNTFQRSGPKP